MRERFARAKWWDKLPTRASRDTPVDLPDVLDVYSLALSDDALRRRFMRKLRECAEALSRPWWGDAEWGWVCPEQLLNEFRRELDATKQDLITSALPEVRSAEAQPAAGTNGLATLGESGAAYPWPSLIPEDGQILEALRARTPYAT